MPLTYNTFYILFNYVECVAWWAIAIGLLIRFKSCAKEKKFIIWRAAVILFIFGWTDFFEAPSHARMGWWLWAAKAICFVGLLKCRYDWLGKENFKWMDRTHVLALVVALVVALLAVLTAVLQVVIPPE